MQRFRLCARMCRHIALAFAFILSFAAVSAYAETMEVGGVPVEYSIPKGYVLAAGKAYERYYALMQDGLPAFAIDAFYVPKSVDQLVQAQNGGALAQYMIIMHMKAYENHNFSAEEFEQLKQILGRSQVGDANSTAQERMQQAFAKQGIDASFSSNMLSLGIIEEGEAHVSILILGKQRMERDGKSVDVTQATVSRVILSDAKLVQASLYKTVGNEAEATLFQTEALAVLDSMNFGKTIVESVESVGSSENAENVSSAWRNVGVTGVAGGAIIGVMLVFADLVASRRRSRNRRW